MFRHLTLCAASLAAGLTLPVLRAGFRHRRTRIFDIQQLRSATCMSATMPTREKLACRSIPARASRSRRRRQRARRISSLLTEAFGMKLVVAKYESDDAPAKIVDFYRDKLKKYGKVLECHSQKHGGDVDVHDDDKDSRRKTARN